MKEIQVGLPVGVGLLAALLNGLDGQQAQESQQGAPAQERSQVPERTWGMQVDELHGSAAKVNAAAKPPKQRQSLIGAGLSLDLLNLVHGMTAEDDKFT